MPDELRLYTTQEIGGTVNIYDAGFTLADVWEIVRAARDLEEENTNHNRRAVREALDKFPEMVAFLTKDMPDAQG